MNAKKVYLAALEEITDYYGDTRTARSKVPLMNHIVEGCSIIATLAHAQYVDKAPADLVRKTYYLMAAFCLHPILQNEDSDYCFKYQQDLGVVDTAMDYATVANHYLCTPETDHIRTVAELEKHIQKLNSTGAVRLEVMILLYADKIQNQKDFKVFHEDTHPRAAQLTAYFSLWIQYLKEYWIHLPF